MLVEVMVAPEADAAMGKSIADIKEFEAVDGEVRRSARRRSPSSRG